ncbi:MAG TPA: response regulator [Thermoanaerobaculaceae bacterium]|nr:response regulator [Thermoanaerobaculaceae bacterium]
MALTRVLIADDSPVFRAFVTSVLRDHGLEAVEASTGRQALELMLGQRPQLAILDGLMPLLSGFEVVQKMRESAPDYKPVVFIVTAVYKGRRWESEARQKYQVNEYLQKPFEPHDLVAAIRRHFPEVAAADQTK